MNKLMIFIMIMLHIPLIKSENNSPLAPALYVFGDSLFDSGNNNLLPTLAKANFLPYGIDFDKGPTGRFTNGRTVVDFIAEFLGLPYSPPYMSVQQRVLRREQLTGLNFASASCGILQETGNDLGECLTFQEQVDYFEKLVQEELPKHYQHYDGLLHYLRDSIFMISIGSNDYINTYLNTDLYDFSRRYSPQAFAKLLVDNLSQQFQRLYKLGARKMIMFEIGPLGCIPSITRQFKHNGRCVEDINKLALIFNDQLTSMLHDLTSTLPDSTLVLGHGYGLGYDAIINPSKYDLTDSTNACCTTWLNGTSSCVPELWALTCRNPNKHYFWDGYHLTEPMYRTIASLCFNGSSICTPKNIKELVLQV